MINVAGALVLWWLFHRDFRPRDLIAAMCCALLTINTGLWYFSTLATYAGLSGVLHGVAAAGIVQLILAHQRWGWLLAVLGGAKLAIEYVAPPVLLDAVTRVATEVHWYGALGGIFGVILSRFLGSLLRA